MDRRAVPGGARRERDERRRGCCRRRHQHRQDNEGKAPTPHRAYGSDEPLGHSPRRIGNAGAVNDSIRGNAGPARGPALPGTARRSMPRPRPAIRGSSWSSAAVGYASSKKAPCGRRVPDRAERRHLQRARPALDRLRPRLRDERAVLCLRGGRRPTRSIRQAKSATCASSSTAARRRPASPTPARLGSSSSRLTGVRQTTTAASSPSGREGFLYVTIGDAADGTTRRTLSKRPRQVVQTTLTRQVELALALHTSNPFVGIGGARPELRPRPAQPLPRLRRTRWGARACGRRPDHLGGGQRGNANRERHRVHLAGANLGWPNCEAACSPPTPCTLIPIFQYGHGSTPAETTGCAIIGGHVVRDPALAGLTGRYLYGDLCRNDLRTLDLGVSGGGPQARRGLHPDAR